MLKKSSTHEGRSLTAAGEEDSKLPSLGSDLEAINSEVNGLLKAVVESTSFKGKQASLHNQLALVRISLS